MGYKIKPVLSIAVGSLILLIVCFYNGYPLVTSDTGSYINHAFDFQVPADRSPFYGVFIGLSSLRSSLWLTVIVQSIFLSFLLIEYLKLLWQREVEVRYIIVYFVLITVLTAGAWYAGAIMPDIFAAILLLACILYLLAPASMRKKILYLGILVISLYVHNSHFLILSLVSIVLICLSQRKKYNHLLRRSLVLLFIAIGSIVSMCVLNYAKGFGFTLSSGSPIFLMGKLGETGILNDYLEKNCGKHNYKICAYKDNIPSVAWEYLWLPQSPLYKTGGWDSNKAESKKIVKDVLTTPKYMGIFAVKSLLYTFRQLTQIHISTAPMGYNTSPWIAMDKYYPMELKEYFYSAQNLNTLKADVSDHIHLITFFITMCWILVIWPRLDKKELFTIIYILLSIFIISNAFVTATFANVLDRLQNRIFWLLPTTNIIVLLQYYIRKREAEKTPLSL